MEIYNNRFLLGCIYEKTIGLEYTDLFIFRTAGGNKNKL